MLHFFDGHNDAVNHLDEYKPGGRDFLTRSPAGHLDLPRARAGGLRGGLFALFAYPPQHTPSGLVRTDAGYEVPMAEALDPAYAQQEIHHQLRALHALAARSFGAIRITTTVQAIEQAWSDQAFAIVLHMEGAEAIGPDLVELDTLYAAGLRSLGLVWSRPNAFGYGVPFAYPRTPDTGPGLTLAGKRLVRAANRLGMQLDLSHLNEQGFWDVAFLSRAPLVATHSCAHGICPSARNLTDRQLDAIRDSDGLVGVNLSVPDVRADGHHDANTAIDAVVRHFAYFVERLGIDRVGLGSDFDGATIPSPIGDAAGLPLLAEALRIAGFQADELDKLAHANWLRVLRLSLGS